MVDDDKKVSKSRKRNESNVNLVEEIGGNRGWKPKYAPIEWKPIDYNEIVGDVTLPEFEYQSQNWMSSRNSLSLPSSPNDLAFRSRSSFFDSPSSIERRNSNESPRDRMNIDYLAYTPIEGYIPPHKRSNSSLCYSTDGTPNYYSNPSSEGSRSNSSRSSIEPERPHSAEIPGRSHSWSTSTSQKRSTSHLHRYSSSGFRKPFTQIWNANINETSDGSSLRRRLTKAMD